MKALKLSLVIMAAALLTIGLGGMAYAFHSGGVAYCDGCHTMHNSSGGKAMFGNAGHTINPINKAQFTGAAYLLQGSDQSSTCLNCHAGSSRSSFRVLTYSVPGPGLAPVQLTPGGDFAWLGKTWGTSASGKGERHGHNIIAADFGFSTGDTTLTTAPGGTYSAGNLTCISCHDPHPSARYDSSDTLVYSKIGTAAVPPISASGSTGTLATAGQAVGTYRFLGGAGYKPFSYPAATGFTADPPVAISPSTYNQTEDTNQVRVAYGSGMSEWCANCHANIHTTQPTGTTAPFRHPAGANALLSAAANIGGTSTTIAAIYNAYKGSGDLTGVQASSYWSLVPYEENVGRGQLRTNNHWGNTGAASQIVGPSSTENVMCVSCHRVHASGFASMGRWDFGAQFITQTNTTYNYSTSNGASAPQSELEYEAAMNGRLPGKFVSYQRNLCNKCHAKD